MTNDETEGTRVARKVRLAMAEVFEMAEELAAEGGTLEDFIEYWNTKL